MKTCAALLIECLENEGVERIFGVPGEEVLDILNALSYSRIQFVSTRHEQGAAFMADAHGRLTGRAGVCLATLGPGATNLVTGVADATLDHAPLVAITGQGNLAGRHKETHQFVDLMTLFDPVTKWSAQIVDPVTTPEVVRKAFRLAQEAKQGAAYIQVPENVAAQPTAGVPLRVTAPPAQIPSGISLERATNLISEARRPIVLAGNGVYRDRAVSALRDFIHHLKIPVVETFMGKGDIDARDPLFMSIIGIQALDGVLCGLEDSDVVICVGYDLVEFAPRHWNPRADKQIIHVDVRPAEVDEFYQPTAEVVGSIGVTLQALAAVIAPPRNAPTTALAHAIADLNHDGQGSDACPIKPQRVIADLRSALGPTDIVTCDVGAHKLWVARMFPTYEPSTVLISNGLAAMGFALPAAIAAKLAYPARHVVAVCGDGGFMMNSQELETAKRLGTAIVVLIWVDGSYSLIGWKQEQRFGHEFGVRFSNPDFRRYAEAYGLPGFSVTKSGDLLPTLRHALSLNAPAIVAVPIDYRENARLVERLGEITCPA